VDNADALPTGATTSATTTILLNLTHVTHNAPEREPAQLLVPAGYGATETAVQRSGRRRASARLEGVSSICAQAKMRRGGSPGFLVCLRVWRLPTDSASAQFEQVRTARLSTLGVVRGERPANSEHMRPSVLHVCCMDMKLIFNSTGGARSVLHMAHRKPAKLLTKPNGLLDPWPGTRAQARLLSGSSANFRAVYPVFVTNGLAPCSSENRVSSPDPGDLRHSHEQHRAALITGRHDALAVRSEIYGADIFAKV
jgi:hypothetical protein